MAQGAVKTIIESIAKSRFALKKRVNLDPSWSRMSSMAMKRVISSIVDNIEA